MQNPSLAGIPQEGTSRPQLPSRWARLKGRGALVSLEEDGLVSTRLGTDPGATRADPSTLPLLTEGPQWRPGESILYFFFYVLLLQRFRLPHAGHSQERVYIKLLKCTNEIFSPRSQNFSIFSSAEQV